MSAVAGRRLPSLKALLCTLIPACFFYYCVTRLVRGYRTIFGEVLLLRSNSLSSAWPLRMIAGLLLITLLVALFWALSRKLPRLPGAFSLLALLGVGMPLTILAALLAPGALNSGAWITKAIMALPLVAFLLFSRSERLPAEIPRGRSSKWEFRLAAFCVGVITWRVGLYFAYDALLKPQTDWDETGYWWPALKYVQDLGLVGYVRVFAESGYDPGYVLSLSTLYSLIPAFLRVPLGNFSAFSFGLCFLAFLYQSSQATPRKHATLVLLTLVYLLLVPLQGGWVPILQWIPGNGDGAATLLILLALWMSSSLTGQTRAQRALLGFGLGAFGALIKPPLSYLMIAVVLTLAGGEAWRRFRGGARLRSFTVLAAAAVSAVLSRFLWKQFLVATARSSYYGFTMGDFLKPALTPTNTAALKLLWTDYRILSIFFLGTALLCLLRKKQRRWLPELTASFGLVSSVIILYLTFWKQTEPQSAGRYVSQGMLAWVLFFFLKESRFFLANFRYWRGLARRLKNRRKAKSPPTA